MSWRDTSTPGMLSEGCAPAAQDESKKIARTNGHRAIRADNTYQKYHISTSYHGRTNRNTAITTITTITTHVIDS